PRGDREELPDRRRRHGDRGQGHPRRLAGAGIAGQGGARAHAPGDPDQHVDRPALCRALGHLPQGAQAARMSTRRYRGSLAVWVLLILYASLYPFWPLRAPAEEALAAMFGRPRYMVAFDVGLNIVAYMPLGVLAALYFMSSGKPRPLL